ncbi:hypothetical protein KCU67_g1361, partial [Aureobasidium melanogenum]
MTWPGSTNGRPPWVPSAVAYRRTLTPDPSSEHEPNTFSENSFAFGFDITSAHESYRICYPKLLLPEDHEDLVKDVWIGLEPTKEDILLRLKRIEKSESDVELDVDLDISSAKSKLQVDAALRRVLLDIFSTALRAAKSVIERDQQLECPKYRFMITVPATWADSAITKTFRAAEEAGSGPSTYTISEPEAAMHQIVQDNERLGRLKAADVAIVCDGGGGTIDVISHEVVSRDPLQMREAVVGEGKRGGGVHLDAGLFALMEKYLGPAKYRKLRQDSECVARWQTDFERIKNTHPRPDMDRHYEVSAPYRTVHETVKVLQSELDALYDLEIAKIKEMMDSQIKQLVEQKKLPNYICLVGGFGSSKYVQKRLQESYPSIKVVQCLHPHTAVVEGAVRALWNRNFIASRKARNHIGVLCEKQADSASAVRDELDGKKWLPRQITYLLKRGDDLSVMEQETRELDFYDTVREKQLISTSYDIWFVISKRHMPPRNFSEASLYKNTDNEEWFRLQIDLTRYEKYFKLVDEGTSRKHLRLDFQLNVRYAGSSLVFHLKIDGKEVQSLARKYVTSDEQAMERAKLTGTIEHDGSSKRARSEKSPPSPSGPQAKRQKDVTADGETQEVNPIPDTIKSQHSFVSKNLTVSNEQDESSDGLARSEESSLSSGQQLEGQLRPSTSWTPVQRLPLGDVSKTSSFRGRGPHEPVPSGRLRKIIKQSIT